MEGPGYWSPRLSAMAMKKEEMPDVASLQRTFVRYGAGSEPAMLASSWRKDASESLRSSLENGHRLAAGRASPADISSARLPDALSLEIRRAPAEFAEPVKQDRRFKPPFQVRLKASFSSTVSCSVTVKAYTICQSEYERIALWVPHDLAEERSNELVDRLNPSHLKGDLSMNWKLSEEVKGSRDALGEGTSVAPSRQLGVMRPSGPSPMLDALLTTRPTHDFPSASRTVSCDDDEQLESRLHELLNEPSVAPRDRRSSLYSQQPAGAPYGEGYWAGSQVAASPSPVRVVSRDMAFRMLEFARPSRLSPVYMVFVCQVASVPDLMYTVYTVPTVCICRKEQRRTACQRLGIPLRDGEPPIKLLAVRQGKGMDVPPPPKPAPAPAWGIFPDPMLAAPMMARPANMDEAHLSLREEDLLLPGDLRSFEIDDLLAPFGTTHVPGLLATGVVAMDVEDFIVDSYQALGMQRRLTHLDIHALLALAGFPQLGAPDVGEAVISHDQYEDFKQGWQAMLALLRRIHKCWNMEEPCTICGFEIDHACAVAALRCQPPGTFLCRFSQSQPGNLVLVCKVSSQSVNADEAGLVHGLLNTADLVEQSLDQRLLLFPGASHLLDIYANRRTDKRVTFPNKTLYCSLERLQLVFNDDMSEDRRPEDHQLASNAAHAKLEARRDAAPTASSNGEQISTADGKRGVCA